MHLWEYDLAEEPCFVEERESRPGRDAHALMSIEVGEHRKLLRLYYASYAEATSPSAQTRQERIKALDACNRFYAGGELCR